MLDAQAAWTSLREFGRTERKGAYYAAPQHRRFPRPLWFVGQTKIFRSLLAIENNEGYICRGLPSERCL